MSKETIFEMMKETIIDILPDIEAQTITIKNSLKEMGANSVDRMDIIIDMMERLEVKIPLVEFGNLKNIEEIVELFYNKKEL